MPTNLLFATSSNPGLAQLLVDSGRFRLGQAELGRFKDGEIAYKILEPVNDQEVYVLGSTYPPAENFLELVTVINTLKINQVKKITLIIPYFGYAKSDRTNRPNVPVNARLFTKFLEFAGIDAVVALNLHSDLCVQNFSVPMIHLSAMSLFAQFVRNSFNLNNPTVASPDLGGVVRAQEFAKSFGLSQIITVEKYRPADDQAIDLRVDGNPKDKDIIIVDDMTQTGNTLIAAANSLKKLGAHKIYAAVTHLVYSGPALTNLITANIFEKFIITDSIPTPSNTKLPDQFTVLPISNLILNAIPE